MGSTKRNDGLLGLLAGLALAMPAAADETVRQDVFLLPVGPVQLGDVLEPTVMRSRPLFVNTNALGDIEAGRKEFIPLFPDVGIVAAFADVEHDPARACTTLNGAVDGMADGSVNFVLVGDTLTGVVRAPGVGTFQIRGGEDGIVTVTELDLTSFGSCATAIEPPGFPAGAMGDGAAPGAAGDDGSTIDVLVMYTSAARIAAGGTVAIEAEAALAVQAANTAYTNSQITPRLRLVHTAETTYNEGGTYNDHLNRLTSSSDGIMDDAHTLRDTHGADMVALFVVDPSYCGLGWVMNSNSAGFASWAFSVTTWTCAVGPLSFAHELGHNMGCCHDHANCSGGLYSYSWGHRFTGNSASQFRTVMSYAPGLRIPYFSNPDVNYDGQPTGIATGVNAADNARTIDETALTIANFRSSVALPPTIGSLVSDGSPRVQGSNVTLTAQSVAGGTGTVTEVRFYYDVNDDGLLDGGDTQIGADSNSLGGWTWTGPTNSFGLGSNRFFAQAHDDAAMQSGAVETVVTLTAPPPPGVWIGPSGGDWFDVDNWADGTLPTAGMDVTIDGSAMIDSPGALAQTLTIGDGGAVLITTGGSITATTCTIEDGGVLVVSWGTATATTMTVEDGASLSLLPPAGIVAAGSLVIEDGALLVGVGTINGNVTNQGEIDPGLSIGTITINGDFTQDPTGKLSMEILSAGSRDRLDISGSARLGGELEIDFGSPGPAGGQCLDFIESAGLTGDFAVMDVSHINFVVAGAYASDATDASVCLTAVSPEGVVGRDDGARSGRAVSAAGDMDGDGVQDLAVGSPFYEGDIGVQAGRVDVYSGATGTRLYTWYGLAGSRFGESLAYAGDVDGDGRGDVIIGSPRFQSNRGRVEVYSGMDGSRIFKKNGTSGQAYRFGRSVSGNVDVNRDGFDDFIVGAPDERGAAGSRAGAVYVYSGKSGARLVRLEGEKKKDRFGWAVGGIGQADADGYDDFIVGAPDNDARGSNAGIAYVFSGTNASPIYRLKGKRAGDRFGYSVDGAQRIDADVYDDFVIGVPYYDRTNVTDAGRIEVWSGRTGVRIYAKTGWSQDSFYGYFVGGAGDLNGDGLGDFMVGAYLHDGGATDGGRLEVRSGADNSELLAIEGTAGGEWFGISAASLGDIDGDLCPEIAIGAPLDDSAETDGGRVHIVGLTCAPDTGLDVLPLIERSASPRLIGGRSGGTGAPASTSVFDEVLGVLTAWGECAAPCPADRNGDGFVNGGDLLSALGSEAGVTITASETEAEDTEDESEAFLYLNAFELDHRDQIAGWRIPGDYAQTPDAVLILEIGRDGGELLVDGTAWVAGTVHIIGTDPAPGDAIRLVDAQQVFGSFDDFVLDGDLAKRACHLETDDGGTIWLIVDED